MLITLKEISNRRHKNHISIKNKTRKHLEMMIHTAFCFVVFLVGTRIIRIHLGHVKQHFEIKVIHLYRCIDISLMFVLLTHLTF